VLSSLERELDATAHRHHNSAVVEPDESAHPLKGTQGGAFPAEVRAVRPLTRFPSEPSDAIGTVLDGRYRLRGLLGEGAMALVFSAEHAFLETVHAIKILHPSVAALDEMKSRFLREARVTSAVAHEGLVQVSDFGVSPEGLHYLVMEQLEGEELLAWSERRGAATAEEVAAIAIAILEPLEALHAAGYVHRDLKPENLWLVPGASGERPRVKVLDLGIAAVVAPSPEGAVRAGRGDSRRLTRAGHTLGTALYMSPEQALGQAVDGRSDLFSLGCVLWELATDRLAFQGETANELMAGRLVARVEAPSRWNTSLPAWFDEIVLGLMEPEREARIATATEAREAFAAALARRPEGGEALRPDPTEARPGRTVRDGRSSGVSTVAWIGATCAAVALAWGIGSQLVTAPSPQAPEAETSRPSPAPIATPASEAGPVPAEPSPTAPSIAPTPHESTTPSELAPTAIATPPVPTPTPSETAPASPSVPSSSDATPASKITAKPRPRPARTTPASELWQPARPTGAP
jgi:serine/threonine-protein kinase